MVRIFGAEVDKGAFMSVNSSKQDPEQGCLIKGHRNPQDPCVSIRPRPILKHIVCGFLSIVCGLALVGCGSNLKSSKEASRLETNLYTIPEVAASGRGVWSGGRGVWSGGGGIWWGGDPTITLDQNLAIWRQKSDFSVFWS